MGVMENVVVLGGGYAGILAATRLVQKGLPARVTLVDAKDHFVERIRLHQVAAGDDLPRRPYAPFLTKLGVGFVQARAEEIDLEAQRIRLYHPDGRMTDLPYDRLVYALGSYVPRNQVPGLEAAADSLTDMPSALALRAKLKEKPGRVTIVGGGLTAIEAACEIAERVKGAQVSMITPALEPSFSEGARDHMRTVLGHLGVELIEGARVTSVDGHSLQLEGGAAHEFDTLAWCAGFGVPDLAARAGLAVDNAGRARGGRDMRSVSHPNVFLAGDASAIPAWNGDGYRASCAMAMPMGYQVANNVARAIKGKKLRDHNAGYLFRCVSLGRKEGLVQYVDRQDQATTKIKIGKPGARHKEMICKFTWGTIAAQRRSRVPLYFWPKMDAPKAA